MLSNASRYAIRSVIYLAIHSGENEKIGVKSISKTLETPQPFLAKLLQQLSRNNLVSSSKGATGGFFLSKDNLQNSMWDVVKCIDGPEKFDLCFLGLPSCGDDKPCPVHDTVKPFKEKIHRDFKDKTIEEFVGELVQKGETITLNGNLIQNKIDQMTTKGGKRKMIRIQQS